MARLIGVGPQDRRTKLEVVCMDCGEIWIMGRFPISVERLEYLSHTGCGTCGGSSIEVFEECLRDPNDDRVFYNFGD